MRILFGVQGEGLGHAVRSSIVINHLVDKGHEVHVCAGGKAYDFLAQLHTDITRIHAYRLVYTHNTVRPFRSWLLAVWRFPGYTKCFFEVRKLVKDFTPDIVLSDYEPLTLLASFGIPNICLNNQQDITFKKAHPNLAHLIPFWLTQIVTWLFTLRSQRSIVYTIYEQEPTKRITYAPHLIRRELLSTKPKIGKHVLVYQTSASNTRLLEELKQVKENFIIHGFNRHDKDMNLQFRDSHSPKFYEDLVNCKAIIANGGMTLLSEAIFLGKPVLSIPVRGQYEQHFNAQMVHELGFGHHVSIVSKEAVRSFLAELPKFRKSLKKAHWEPRAALDEIDNLILSSSQPSKSRARP